MTGEFCSGHSTCTRLTASWCHGPAKRVPEHGRSWPRFAAVTGVRPPSGYCWIEDRPIRPPRLDERHARDQLWKELKRLVAANRQAADIRDLVQQAEDWLLGLSPQETLRKAGILSPHFWLKHLLQ